MNAIGEAGYILSKQELVYLAALTGTNTLLGVKDNTSFLSKDEIQEFWPSVKDSLHDKQYLDEDAGETVHIDSGLLHCISVCAKPRLYIGCAKHREPEYFNCYVDYGVCVKLEEKKTMKGTFILTPFTSHQSIRNVFLDFFIPEGHYESRGKASFFTKAQLDESKDAADTDEGAEMDIEEKETAEMVLRDKQAPHSIIKMNLDDNGVQKTSTYTVYIGKKTIWRLQANKAGQDMFTFMPISKEKLISNIQEQTNAFKYFYRKPAEFSSGLARG